MGGLVRGQRAKPRVQPRANRRGLFGSRHRRAKSKDPHAQGQSHSGQAPRSPLRLIRRFLYVLTRPILSVRTPWRQMRALTFCLIMLIGLALIYLWLADADTL